MIEYSSINLNDWKEVVMAALPSISSLTTHLMSYCLLVKGAAIEASASLSEIPTAAVFRAPQSFAPSPQMPQLSFKLD